MGGGFPGNAAPSTPSVSPMASPMTSTSPSIGTKISAAPITTPSVKGQTVAQVNRTFSPTGVETTSAPTWEQINAGDRSIADTVARGEETQRLMDIANAGIDEMHAREKAQNESQATIDKYGPGLAQGLVALHNAQPAPTPRPTSAPTPAPKAPAQQSFIQKAPVQVIAPAIQKAVQQVAQKIAPVITQSPWSWLGKKTGWW
jgi:hypothetical protein